MKILSLERGTLYSFGWVYKFLQVPHPISHGGRPMLKLFVCLLESRNSVATPQRLHCMRSFNVGTTLITHGSSVSSKGSSAFFTQYRYISSFFLTQSENQTNDRVNECKLN